MSMFYAKWFGQVLLIMLMICLVVILRLLPQQAVLVGLVAVVWSIWLLATLVRHLFGQPREPSTEHSIIRD
jgi:hypothetical protein